jgi:hypothetical protein
MWARLPKKSYWKLSALARSFLQWSSYDSYEYVVNLMILGVGWGEDIYVSLFHGTLNDL